jgi:tetratricopeptide (TPR) repeat protein
MMEHRTLAPADPPPSGLRRAAQAFAAAWSGGVRFTLALLPLAGVAALLFLLVREVRREDVEVAPIAVPPRLVEAGLTPEVVALRLQDAIEQIARSATAERVDRPATELAGSQPDFNVPIAGLSLRGVASLVRSVLGLPQRRVSGEIIAEPGERIAMRLRITGAGQIAEVRGQPVANPDALLAAAAPAVWRVLEPRIYAWHLVDSATDLAAARDELDRMARVPRIDAATARTIAYVDTRILMRQGQHAEAARLAEQLTTQHPGFALGWHARGLALMAMARPEESLAALRQGVVADPNAIHPRLALSWQLRNLRRYDEALAVLAEARRITPDSSELWVNEALTLNLALRPAEAVVAARRAVAADPRSAPARGALIETLVSSGQAAEALAASETAIALVRPTAYLIHARGRALAAVGRIEEGLAALREAEARDPTFPWTPNARGWVLMRERRFAEAADAFEAAVRIRPYHPFFHRSLANALVEMERRADAQAALDRARALGDVTAQADALQRRISR